MFRKSHTRTPCRLNYQKLFLAAIEASQYAKLPDIVSIPRPTTTTSVYLLHFSERVRPLFVLVSPCVGMQDLVWMILSNFTIKASPFALSNICAMSDVRSVFKPKSPTYQTIASRSCRYYSHCLPRE